MLKKLMEIWSVFLKVGFLGFGGGNALIPVIKNQIVDKKKWFTDEEYLKHTIIGNITPGALSVKIAAIVGYEMLGGIGSIVAAYAATIPGVILTVGVLISFVLIGDQAVGVIKYTSVGVSVFIISLMAIYILNVVKTKDKESFCKLNVIICIIAFILTSGKEVNNITRVLLGYKFNGINLFDISTINLMIISFFIILFYGLLKTKKSLFIAVIVSCFYIFINEKDGFNGAQLISSIIVLTMIILVIYAIKKNNKGNKSSLKEKRFKINKQSILAMSLFIIIPIIIMIFAIMLVTNKPENAHMISEFTGNVTSSTITAFGGGASYISVADGFFVQNGFIMPEDFYSKVVAVSNTMPGPLVVKIASGVGFVFGGSIQGVMFGIFIAILAMTSVVGSCCVISLIVLIGYDTFKESKELILIKKYILPVIGGMLISTSLNMLYETMKTIASVGIGFKVSFVVTIIAISALYIINKKFKINDLIILILSGGTSLILLNLI